MKKDGGEAVFTALLRHSLGFIASRLSLLKELPAPLDEKPGHNYYLDKDHSVCSPSPSLSLHLVILLSVLSCMFV
jgi:hypothetical protein